jgi:hypothetical protein
LLIPSLMAQHSWCNRYFGRSILLNVAIEYNAS